MDTIHRCKWNWIFPVIAFAMIVPFAALYVVNRIKEKFHKTRGESKYMDYATASYSVGQLVDPAVIGRRSVTVTIVCDILDKFEECTLKARRMTVVTMEAC